MFGDVQMPGFIGDIDVVGFGDINSPACTECGNQLVHLNVEGWLVGVVRGVYQSLA